MARAVVMSVVGTRPNFMKIAPVMAALDRRSERFEHVLVHTGQHYQDEMSARFLSDLGIGEPQFHLGVGRGSSSEQTSRILDRLAPILTRVRPDVVLVPGDVTSTLAAALAAAQAGIAVGHIEAGLRSFDPTMPEEMNRRLVDMISKLLFTHSPEARTNLQAEGVGAEHIFEVGNTMIDTLILMRNRLDSRPILERWQLNERAYIVVTLHRPSLVDGTLLAPALNQLEWLAEHIPVVFPVHPRTRAQIDMLGFCPAPDSRLHLTPPLGYLEFVGLVAHAAAVLTDSGGIQEETTFLGVPCFTLRANTERPVTVDCGTNTLLGLDTERIRDVPALLDAHSTRRAHVPQLWDGRAGERIAAVLEERIGV